MKNTDKQRLDWLEKEKLGVGYNVEVQAWGLDYESPYKKTLRKAIDAAIRAERKKP